MIAVADPFMAGTPTRRPGDFSRNKQGTPYVSDPTGRFVKRKRKADPDRIATLPYGRPSGFGKQIEDMYSIMKWAERQICLGFAVNEDVLLRALPLNTLDDRDSKEWRDAADSVVAAAKRAAKAGIAAERGTHAHELTEDDDNDRDIIARIEAGEELGLSHDVQRSLVNAWREMLDRDGLEILAIEAPVVHDGYRQAGTLDRIARLSRPLRFTLVTGEVIELAAGTVVVLDVKSGKRRLNNNGTVMYWQSYAVQVAVYAAAVPYDTETDTRGVWPFQIDQEWALIAHLDVLGAMDGRPSCELVLVDLKAGRAAADLCVAAKAWENETTVFSVAQLDPAGEQLADSTTEVAPSLGGEIVEEGVGRDPVAVVGCDPVANVSPSSTPFAGEVEGAACTPSPALNSAGRTGTSADSDGGRHVSNGNGPAVAPSSPVKLGWPEIPDRVDTSSVAPSDPSRLALVDARGTLCETPSQGADLSDEGAYGELWDRMQVEFNALPAEARSWRAALVTEAQRRGVPFHVQVTRTERTYHINKALIALATAGQCDDEIVRHLLGPIVGDVAYFVGVGVGHVVGSLSAPEAERFAALVDAFLAEPGGDAA